MQNINTLRESSCGFLWSEGLTMRSQSSARHTHRASFIVPTVPAALLFVAVTSWGFPAACAQFGGGGTGGNGFAGFPGGGDGGSPTAGGTGGASGGTSSGGLVGGSLGGSGNGSPTTGGPGVGFGQLPNRLQLTTPFDLSFVCGTCIAGTGLTPHLLHKVSYSRLTCCTVRIQFIC